MTGSVEDHDPVVEFHATPLEPFVSYALGLVAEMCGVTVDTVGADRLGRGVDLYYGHDEAVPCRLRIPRVERYDATTIPAIPSARPAEGGAPFPFDVFAALRFWLADEGNADAPHDAAFDAHDRLLGLHSAQEAVGLREVPIVNAYLLALREWIAARLGISVNRRLPAGKRCVVVLSHDVDRPLDPTDLRPSLELACASWRRAPLRAPVAAAIAAGHAMVGSVRSPRTRRWHFHDVASAEEARGFRSTFFLAATSRFSPGSSVYDVGYDVRAPRWRRVVRDLLERGADVGLHIGYRRHKGDPRSIAAEREQLERAVGTPITGSRHHYWHMGRPFWRTLAAHGPAGLRYDSSVAFNESPGYRLGVGLPLRLWNPETARVMGAVQVPTMAMDGSLFRSSGPTIEGVLAHFERLVGDLKRFEGVAAVDWHQELAFPAPGPRRHWGEAYLELLDLLAADPEVAVMPYEEVLRTCLRVEPVACARAAQDNDGHTAQTVRLRPRGR